MHFNFKRNILKLNVKLTYLDHIVSLYKERLTHSGFKFVETSIGSTDQVADKPYNKHIFPINIISMS